MTLQAEGGVEASSLKPLVYNLGYMLVNKCSGHKFSFRSCMLLKGLALKLATILTRDYINWTNFLRWTGPAIVILETSWSSYAQAITKVILIFLTILILILFFVNTKFVYVNFKVRQNVNWSCEKTICPIMFICGKKYFSIILNDINHQNCSTAISGSIFS